MKVSVLQENLAHGLSIVSRAVSPRTTLPVLGNVLVATDEGRLRLSATNLELGITCWIGAKIEEEGSTTVPARTFSELVATLPPQTVDLYLNVRTQTLNVRCSSSEANLKCIDAQEFPPFPALDWEDGVKLNVAEFKEMVQQVAFAASKDEARPVLTGIQVKVHDRFITLAAADGFRLSLRKGELPQAVSSPISAIIPARALVELARIASDGQQEMTMLLPPGRGQVVFHLKDIELISQLIEGSYPELEQLIPTRYNTRAVLPTQEFLKACRRVEIFAREGSNIARLKIVPGGDLQPGRVEVSGQSEETGSNENRIDAAVEGQPQLIAFNVGFLREVLEVIKTPSVALETTSETAPGVVRPVGEEKVAAAFVHVVMPMHLGG
ncbi:MAG: DNA polymerase III subunit beta [Anaerolineales bacterium]|nr:DNA polymerase III subunit beta [Anaerolineales bacterium]MCS7248706.1 DNA polymerase III subunit beta [Anaerolineales bacterium]MDW8162519.1 DNA polymerase III subunit beta [Anaerolineales bacterium]MDW8445700.1 DNA polymerase III subunit beta [Anaerolineales bacterium]